MNVQPVMSGTAASPPGFYSTYLPANFGKARGNPSEPDSIIQQLQAMSPEEQNAYAMAHASGDRGFWGNVGSAVGNAAKMASPFLFATGAGALADAAGFGGAAVGGDAFEDIAGGGAFTSPASAQLAGDAGFGAGAGFDAADSMFANPAAASVIGGTSGAGAAGAFDDIANGGAFSSGGAGASGGAAPGAFDDIVNGGAFTSGPASPSILDIVGKFMKSGGLAGQIGQALGLSPGTSSALGGLWSAGSGLYGLYQSSQLKKQAQKYAAAADPFGPYRSQYADQLSALTRDPSGITKMPGYEAGLQAVQRSMAAQGYNGSGNMMTALSKYGGDFYNNAVSQLSGLAGAGINPANGASIGLSGQAGGDNLALNSLGLIGKGLVGMR